ncbi:MAG: response regulator [Algicola sp.]|nr:response regulator [Algicola sp.]
MNRLKLYLFLFAWPTFMLSQDGKQVAFRELTVEQGLSQNSVVSIAQDHTGFMWFATQDGLNKYDGKQFKHFPYQFEDVTRNTFSKLGKVYVDNHDNVWFIANSGRLHKQGNAPETFELVSNINKVSAVLQTTSNDYFIGTYGSGFYKIQHKTNDTIQILKAEDKHLVAYDLYQQDEKVLVATSNGILEIGANNTYRFIDVSKNTNFSALAKSAQNNKLFLGSYGKGLFVADDGTMTFKPFTGFKHAALPDDLIIQDILVDSSGKLWIATYGDGAYLVDFKKASIQHFLANKTDPYALHYNDVLNLYEDFTGIVWLGTDGSGLSYYDEDLVKFNVLTNKQTPGHINIDFVRAIVEHAGNVWLGTSNKGLTSIDFKTNTYNIHTTSNSTLASNRIMSLCNQNGKLWVGHQNSGLQKMVGDAAFKTFEDTKGMSIWKIYNASNNRLWLCTLNGLILFDEAQGVVKKYNSENSNLTSDAIRTVEAGDDGQLYIGMESDGVFLLNTKTDSIAKIEAISDRIKSLYYHAGVLWVGTNGNGLKSYNTRQKSIKHFTTNEGLANNVVYAILPGAKNKLWLSSNKGLSKITINTDLIVDIENFSNYDGLQTNEFNTGAYFKDENGTLYFGGLEGLNWFKPSQLSYNSNKPRTVITGFDIFAKPHPIVQDNAFSANQNTMTFTFSGLHYSQPNRNKYKYQLVNHDPEWISSGNNNTAHYTNLPPNTYTFKVISSNYDGVWNNVPATYTFTIKKPWFLSTLAIICYALLVFALSIWVYRYLKWRWHMKMQLEFEHKETTRLKKLDELKTKLYTNISHEFRTPLTLISGPIESQLKKKDLNAGDKKELFLVKQNANRLLNLVNQMLDLSMIDSGQQKLKVSKGNLTILLNQLIEAFQYQAREKDITLNVFIGDLKYVWFDEDIVEKIVSNLLSNAIKYAPKGSEVSFSVSQNGDDVILSIINKTNQVTIENLNNLFKRFYQDNEASDGVGVGLALVKELVNLSKGTIVANNVGDNSLQFSVTLPVAKAAFNDDEIVPDNTRDSDIPQHTEASKTNGTLPKLLIVEDNDDIREFVTSLFKSTYTIITANNGQEGVEKAIENLPDLVISDIMMPIKDGITLCHEIKTNTLTSHIPVVLLTAKIGEENEIEGYKTGADAYITKPFSSEKLKLIVAKQIEARNKLELYYGKTLSINPDLAITTTENEFLKQLQLVLEAHVTDPEFTSAKFSELMQMSRTQLHRKLHAIVGKSTSEVIRSQRLKLAVDLLKASSCSISEVAYQVGFNSPSYFNKCFKEAYGCTPKEFIENRVPL